MTYIAAIVVTFNPENELLLKQFRYLTFQVSTIIYVDNGSYDVTTIESLGEYRNVRVHLNNRNLGIAEAQNIGIAIAKEIGATHILLMDQDSIPAERMVSCLYQTLCLFPSAGCIAPCTHDSYTGQIARYGILISGFRLNHVPLIDKPVKVSYCIASGALIPMSVIDHVGAMKPDLFIDNVDFEWCLRAKKSGYDIIITPQALLYHKLGNGNKDRILSHNPQREYYILRNNIALVKMKHIPLGFRLRKLILSFLRLSKSVLRGNKAYAISGLRGIYDGFKTDFNQ